MMKSATRALALAAMAALAACSSGTSGAIPKTGTISLGTNNGLTQQNFVGIGDSLTFGEQGDGDLGVVTTSPLSAAPNGLVQPTQTDGFWALMYAQMNGITLDPTIGHWNTDTALGAATSPLPLIAAPGLGSEFAVPSTQGAGFAATHSSCDAFNDAGYGSTTWQTTRVNAGAPIGNLGVPGITMHEAVSMTSPLTGPPTGPNCSYVAIPGDTTSGGLQSLVNAESNTFYPVLGQFQGVVPDPTQLNDALFLKPHLTTVWLGANDLLKFIFSHGQSPVTDSPSQFTADLTKIVTSLEAGGSKVVIGNLPDILGNPSTNEPPVPQFFPQTKLSADLQALGIPSSAAGAIAAYVSTNYTGGNGGFLTETGFFAVVSQFTATHTVQPQLDPSGPGSGDGAAYVDQTFAAQAIALNAGYNQIINQVAAQTNSGLADIETQFAQIQSGGVPLAPGCTLTLQFGGGIVGFDGLHPANTGYALIANAFIGAADTKFGLTIPPLSNTQIGIIAQNDLNDPCVVKSSNPAWPYPLP